MTTRNSCLLPAAAFILVSLYFLKRIFGQGFANFSTSGANHDKMLQFFPGWEKSQREVEDGVQTEKIIFPKVKGEPRATETFNGDADIKILSNWRRNTLTSAKTGVIVSAFRIATNPKEKHALGPHSPQSKLASSPPADPIVEASGEPVPSFAARPKGGISIRTTGIVAISIFAFIALILILKMVGALDHCLEKHNLYNRFHAWEHSVMDDNSSISEEIRTRF